MNKSLFKFLALLVAMPMVIGAQAQTTVTGKVVDEVTGMPLPGATVTAVGTSVSTATNGEGEFSLATGGQQTANISVRLVGYEEQNVTVPSGTTNLGIIKLVSTSTSLSEIMVTANNLAIDRKTPVAVSTVRAQQIEEKLGNQEFPEVLKTTPGIYVTKTGGGFGDAAVRIRGFGSENVAVMINGIPVNDMENGAVYWSNWAGLSDVASSIQVQRGLGASKVAVPSIGGTINITTRTTDAVKGGSIYYGIGNNGLQKMSVSLSTGLTENGWAFSVLGSKTSGDGWAEGLQFEGYSYFFNLSKQINDKHSLSLTGFGAPQRHGQRQNRQLISTFKAAPQGLRYNADWGYKDGQIVNVEDNFYHKPQFQLNHNWHIDETSYLTSSIYASVGTGGGGGISGVSGTDLNYRTSGAFSPYDLNKMIARNQQNVDGSTSIYRYASRNDHNWYGLLSTYNKEISDFTLLGGLDLRYYKGKHFQEVTDVLGADYVLSNSDVNHPATLARTGDKIGYYNDGVVLWEGIFLQGEYSNGPLSAFVSLSGSNTSYKRIDYFLYEATDPLRESDFQHILGYQAKGGLNYNFATYHNVFANVGHFSNAPKFDAVYLANQNAPNEDAENENITSFELGYGFANAGFNAKLNFYHTTWLNRSVTASNEDPLTGQLLFANLLGLDARHMGAELELTYVPTPILTIRGMLSLGNWKNTSNLDSVKVFNEEQEEVVTIPQIFAKDVKVGDQAQTSASLGFDLQLMDEVKVGATYIYEGDNYGSYFPDNLNKPGLKPWKIPNYSLVDLNASIGFKIGSFQGTLFANVHNLFDTEYISDANAVFNDAGISNASNAVVYYGFGRTYGTGLRFKF